ncbi:energy transducer TonB [Zunongwangia sp. H14]|uniref:energy transducer TonB n=1 Tax=Zunongwangia sp. H14 TaxID=3240792 RepID=UPI0035696B2A
MKKLLLFSIYSIIFLNTSLGFTNIEATTNPCKSFTAEPRNVYSLKNAENSFLDKEPGFTAKGLNYEIELTDIYMGNFKDVPFERKGMFFYSLFSTYIWEYARFCPHNLSPDKIQLTRQVCDQEEVIKNSDGIEISRNCISWRNEKTGYYADKDMYAAMRALEGFQLGNVLSMAGTGDGIGTAAKMMGEIKAISLDVVRLLQMNGCNSPALKQFQENLRLFALEQQPVRLENLIAERRAERKEISPLQDVEQLVEDLVYENSRQWNFNQYQQGSVENVQILARDTQGRPQKLKADYLFTGFAGKKKGSVTVTFNNACLPECLYFFDFPTICRPASRKITNDYAKNAYVNLKSSPDSRMRPIDNQFENKDSTQYEVEDVLFDVVENAPVFPGCENKERKACMSNRIHELVTHNFNTQIIQELGLKGTIQIYVKFKINKDGSIVDVHSIAPHPVLEQEAIRVVKLLPKMKPGLQRGKPVGVLYSLPFVLRANGKNTITKAESLLLEEERTAENEKNISNNQLRHLFNLNKKEKD